MPNASEQLGVEFSLKDLNKVLKGFTKIAKGADDTAKSIQSSLSGISTGTTTARQRAYQLGAGSLAQNGGSTARQRAYTMGPRQRADILAAQHQRAIANGDKTAAADIADAMKRNSRRLQLMQPKSTQDRIMDVLKTTRLNFGHASPLVGRTLAALGPEVAALALPIGLAVGAMVLFTAAVVKGAQEVEELGERSAAVGNLFNRLQISTGSGTGTSASLISLGTAGGLKPDQMAQLAQSLQEHITGSPMGMAFGMQAGVYNLPGAFGNQDYGKQLLQVSKYLRDLKDPIEQLRAARAMGVEPLLATTKTSDKQFGMSEADAGIRSSLMSPKFLQESADFQASMGRVTDSVDNLLAALGPAVLPVLTGFFNTVADDVNAFAQVVGRHSGDISGMISGLNSALVVLFPAIGAIEALMSIMPQAALVIDDILTAIVDVATGNMGGAMKSITNLQNDWQGKVVNALDANTKATDANTQLMPGQYGHTTRTGFQPEGINGESIRRAGQGGFVLSSF